LYVTVLNRRLPARVQNRTFAKLGAQGVVVSTVLLLTLIPVHGYFLLFDALLGLTSAAVTVFFIASWHQADLRVSHTGVMIGGIFNRRAIPWRSIERFEIRGPVRRTPLVLAFRWWTDQALVVLIGGSTLRVRALEPWHGFTALSYITTPRKSLPDETIDWLNEIRQQSVSAHPHR
jgi:hypothetical protein